MRGPDVAELQRRLQSLGYNVGPIDGIFGRQTERAVRQFQRDNNLVPDGVVGPRTIAVLEQLIP
jgi:peptidoglycan hydrolase-like protein with peptidoglycan-binding domain